MAWPLEACELNAKSQHMSNLNASNSSFPATQLFHESMLFLGVRFGTSCFVAQIQTPVWLSPCSSFCGFSFLRVSSDHDLTSNSSVWGSIEELLHIEVHQALFGHHLPAGGIDVEIVFANPQHGTTATNDTTAYAGKIVMVRRGQCEFGIKGLNVDAVNGAAMVVYGCSSEPPEFCDATGLVTMIASQGSLVPSYYIPNAPGEALKDLVEAGNVLTAHLPGTGPIDPNDRIALQAIYDNMGGAYWSFQDYGLDEGLWGWDELANTSFDPCLERIYGIICIDG
eukprot:g64922.t1